MQVLSCTNINKSYVVDPILEDISFSVNTGDKIGVIGHNGSGKTTLFKILAGKISKDSGDIFMQKSLKIGYLEQHTTIDSKNTLFDECLDVFKPLIKMEEDLRDMEEKISQLGSSGHSKELDNLMHKYSDKLEKFNEKNGYGYKSNIRGTLIGLGFSEEDFTKEIHVLSGGQKARVSLAKLLLEEPDILLLDEPTNHLDIEAIGWLERFLNDYPGASLIISHDRYFLDNVVNRIFHINNLKLKAYNTNYTDFMKRRKIDLELEQKHYENQQREIKRQEEIIRKFMSHGLEKHIKQAKSRQKMLDKMKLIEGPEADKHKARITFQPKVQSGQDVLKLKNVTKSYGEKTLFEDISFNIYKGERVGLIGPNGVGKTSLFKIILGQIKKDQGQVILGHNVQTGYFDQEMRNLNLDKTIIDEIWDENPKFDHYTVRKVLSQFMFIGDDIFKEISDLSGGERGRLSLLKLMLSNANFLIMDEPTNHLDIDSKEVLEDALLDYDGTVFVISHDRYFLNRVADKILELETDGLTEYYGNYNYYFEKKNELKNPEEEKEEKTKTQIKQEKKKERELQIEQREKKKKLKALEKEIHKLELDLESIDEKLCDPEIYSDNEKVLELSSKREELELSINQLYEDLIQVSEDL